jgi:hypothetical protein
MISSIFMQWAAGFAGIVAIAAISPETADELVNWMCRVLERHLQAAHSQHMAAVQQSEALIVVVTRSFPCGADTEALGEPVEQGVFPGLT